MNKLKALRIIIRMETEDPIYDYTGRLTKTLLYMLTKELRLFHNIRGIISPIIISPPFTKGKKELEIGEPVIPQYLKKEDNEHIITPVIINGEYIIHVGGEEKLIQYLQTILEKHKKETVIFKFDETIITNKLEEIHDITQTIQEKTIEKDKITIYLKSPTLLFNVYVKSRLPKFTTSSIETLMTPYMYYTGKYTIDQQTLLQATTILGYLVETYYSLKTIKPIIIPFKKKKEVALTGKITYIIDTNKKQTRKQLEKILQTLETVGTGESRLNGFGTATWSPK